jgi:tetratricopeptide (TPR) repeat protein
MADQKEKTATLLRLKTAVTLVITTVMVVSGVWGFIFFQRIELKNDYIDLLREQNRQLSEFGGVPEEIKRLEELLIPLSLAIPMDPLNGRVNVGVAIGTPTEITTLIIEAQDLVNKKKFDLAEAKLREIKALHPSFLGTVYLEFWMEKEKGNTREALTLAEDVIQHLSDDERILPAYEFAVETNLQSGNRKKAEDLCLAAMQLDPENESWRSFLEENFGYRPSIPNG